MKSILALCSYVSLWCSTVNSSCVFESDFGFTLNCGIKKSGLFRVRNLGGVKGYVGVGFSVGDELGFKDSLSNVESNNRRSVDNPRLEGPVVGALALPTDNNGDKSAVSDPAKGDEGFSSRSINGLNNHMINARRAAPKVAVPPFKPILSLSMKVPAFHALPPSIAKVPTLSNHQPMRRYSVVGPNTDTGLVVKNDLGSGKDLITEDTSSHMQDDLDTSKILLGHSLESIAKASNISIETLAAAIKVRQQEIAQKIALEQKKHSILVTLPQTTSTTTTATTTATTTTTTTPKPIIKLKHHMNGPHQVMNAPREYYPVKYEKDFDDNFTSKVELPDTSFECGEQKHFPGLYADEDLGCMVFHVCAFTDDGLVMKSFLCPESTLFDQTILKCNWWFYVDCKSSKKLYDSNIPMSKSYQLMKALTFFSSYSTNKDTEERR